MRISAKACAPITADHYPLTPEARADRYLNPGAGWVSALGFEPRVGLAVLYEMLAPHLSSGRIVILTRHRPVALHMEGDHARAVTVLDETDGRAAHPDRALHSGCHGTR